MPYFALTVLHVTCIALHSLWCTKQLLQPDVIGKKRKSTHSRRLSKTEREAVGTGNARFRAVEHPKFRYLGLKYAVEFNIASCCLTLLFVLHLV